MSESIPDAISLSTLPPDLIRKIIPMIDEPFKTGVNMISRSWNEFEHLRYRPIDNIRIVPYGENHCKMEVMMHEKDKRHFGLNKFSKITKVSAVSHKMNVKFVEPIQKDVMCSMLKAIFKVCSKIKVLWLDNLDCGTVNCLSDCFGSTRIENLIYHEKNWVDRWIRGEDTTDHSMDSNIPILKEMAMKHKISKVYYNGNVKNL